jgi:hypothetical protein
LATVHDGRRHRCSPGSYADKEGTVDAKCAGECDSGYYCKAASPSRQQYKCGSPDVFCPAGSSEPTPIRTGFYGRHTGIDAGALALLDPHNLTFSIQLACGPGYYCTNGIRHPCPPGTFGWRHGMTNASCGGKCAAGFYCPSYLNPLPQAPSYTVWPKKPHTHAAELECGGPLGTPSSISTSYYCPRGSYFPLLVTGGFYTVGGDNDNFTRSGQITCPKGTFCRHGVMQSCPPRYFGEIEGMQDEHCSGHCPSGNYCPERSPAPVPCPPTEYAPGGQEQCIPCPNKRNTALPCQDKRECCFQGIYGDGIDKYLEQEKAKEEAIIGYALREERAERAMRAAEA